MTGDESRCSETLLEYRQIVADELEPVGE